MSDLISRKWLMECVDEGWIKFDTEKDKNTYVHLVRDIAPSAQPEPCDDLRADIYYLAEKIGIHRLYALVVELRGEPEPCKDAVSRQAAIDAVHEEFDECLVWDESGERTANEFETIINRLPSAEPEIIRCKDCKFWTHIKRTKRHWCKTDDGLYDLNTSADDFCSRAERRTDE